MQKHCRSRYANFVGHIHYITASESSDVDFVKTDMIDNLTELNGLTLNNEVAMT
jgi:hypothetical protein